MQPSVLTGASLPVGLADLSEPPRRLYCVGNLPPAPWVAVVGTRAASGAALEFTRELAAALCARGVTVASGGALGIDAAAHEGVLCAGGKTVVVAPSSYRHPSPREHVELFERIVRSGGAHLTPFDDEQVARRHLFFLRNAVLVACSVAVVVVESPLRSGARNAAAAARKLGRPLFVVPHAPWHARGRGCIEELRLGARPLSSAKDVLRTLEERGYRDISDHSSLHEGAGPSVASPAQAALPGLSTATPAPGPGGVVRRGDSALERRVAAVLPMGRWTHLEQLVTSCGVSVAELQALIVRWSLEGRVVVAGDGSVRPV